MSAWLTLGEASPSMTYYRAIESGTAMDITANEKLLRRYREEITAFNDALESFCLRRGIAFAQVTTDVPFEDIVLRALRDGVMIR